MRAYVALALAVGAGILGYSATSPLLDSNDSSTRSARGTHSREPSSQPARHSAGTGQVGTRDRRWVVIPPRETNELERAAIGNPLALLETEVAARQGFALAFGAAWASCIVNEPPVEARPAIRTRIRLSSTAARAVAEGLAEELSASPPIASTLRSCLETSLRAPWEIEAPANTRFVDLDFDVSVSLLAPEAD